MKYAIFSVMVYLSIILQTALFPRVNIFGVQPDLLSALLVSISIAAGPVVGAVMGSLTGLALDLMFMPSPGFYSLQYLVLCLLVGLLASRITYDRFLLPSITCFAGFTLKELITLAYLYLQRVEINFPVAIGKLLIGGVCTVALLIPLYQAVRAINNISLLPGPSIFGDDKR
jgi:rod shape-determining protein MreD